MAPRPRRRIGGAAALVVSLVGFALLEGIAGQGAVSEDPGVLEFREGVEAATRNNDFAGLRELAATEVDAGTPLGAEVQQLQANLQVLVDTAFRNKVEALTQAHQVVQLVELGVSAQVSAAELEAARTKARALAVEMLARQVADGDPDELRRSVMCAKMVGLSASATAAASALLLQQAEEGLQEALLEIDDKKPDPRLGNLIVQIERAKLDGVNETKIAAAEEVLHKKTEEKIGYAQSTQDTMAMAEAVETAERVGDTTLAVAAQPMKEQLKERVNVTIQNAPTEEVASLRIGVMLAPVVGITGDAAVAASTVLEGQERKLEASLRLKRLAEAEDWDALRIAVMDAQNCGVDPAEVAQASALVAGAARAEIARSLDGGTLGDVQWAWDFGRAAGLPVEDLAAASSRLSGAASSELLAAQQAASAASAAGTGVGAALGRLAAAARSQHLSDSERAGAQTSVRDFAAAWLAGDWAFAEATDFLRALAAARSMLGVGQMEQSAYKFCTKLVLELNSMATAADLVGLDSAIAAAEWVHSGGAGMWRNIIAYAISDTGAIAAKEAAFDESLAEARRVRNEERTKAEALEELEAVSTSPDVSELRQALQVARDVGCTAVQLAAHEATLQQRENALGAAAAALADAAEGGDLAALQDALAAAEAAGVRYEYGEAFAAAQQKLAALQTGGRRLAAEKEQGE